VGPRTFRGWKHNAPVGSQREGGKEEEEDGRREREGGKEGRREVKIKPAEVVVMSNNVSVGMLLHSTVSKSGSSASEYTCKFGAAADETGTEHSRCVAG